MLAIFVLGLFVSPFFFWPWGSVPYEVPKVNLIRTWIEILVLAGIFSLGKLEINKKKRDPILFYAAVLFFLVVVATSLVGMDRIKSFFGNYYRNDGIITLFHMVTLYLFLVYWGGSKWLGSAVKVIPLTSILLSFWSIITWVRINLLGHFEIETWVDGGIGLAFGNPNFLSGYLLTTFPLTYLFLKNLRKSPKAPVLLGGILIPIAAIIFTKARAGLFGLVYASLIGLIIFGKDKFVKLVGIIFVLFITFLAIYFLSSEKMSGNTFVAESRQRIITKGFMAFAQRPFLGYGWSNFDYAFEAVSWPIHFDKDVYVDKAHSSLLEVLVTTGIFGFALYVVILIRVVKNLFYSDKSTDKYLLVSFLLLIFHMQIQIVSVSEELLFWLIVASATFPVSHRRGESAV